MIPAENSRTMLSLGKTTGSGDAAVASVIFLHSKLRSDSWCLQHRFSQRYLEGGFAFGDLKHTRFLEACVMPN